MSVSGVVSFFFFKSRPRCSSIYLFHNKPAEPNCHSHLQTCQSQYRVEADRLQGSKMALLHGEKEPWKDAEQYGYPQNAPADNHRRQPCWSSQSRQEPRQKRDADPHIHHVSHLSTIQREFEFMPFAQNVVVSGSTTARLEFCLVWCEIQLARYD